LRPLRKILCALCVKKALNAKDAKKGRAKTAKGMLPGLNLFTKPLLREIVSRFLEIGHKRYINQAQARFPQQLSGFLDNIRCRTGEEFYVYR
jgi:hypothetical protein